MFFSLAAAVTLPGSTPGAYYAFQVSDGVGRFIVLFLLAGSVATWAIMFSKAIGLWKAKKLSDDFIARFRKITNIAGLINEAANDPGPVPQVYFEGSAKLADMAGIASPEALRAALERHEVMLTQPQLDAVSTSLERAVSGQVMELEEQTGILATAVSAAPFFGLFGTVWGVMLAFCGVAIAGKPDFQALAPGVAGALLTTVVGLVVAIPSLIGYNLITVTIRKITVNMDNFTEEFMARLKLEMLEAAKSAGELRR